MLHTFVWLLLFLGFYPYVAYPALIWLYACIANQRIARDDSFRPMVTIVTAAFNEARHIEAAVGNKLSEDYPAERMEILVVSDGSFDGTDQIVARIADQDPRVRLLRQEPRQGKTAALNRALACALGEVIIFADANSIYRRGSVQAIVRNFSDPTVGYVTGRMQYVSADGSVVGDGCSAYMKYENALRAAETRAGSIVGADGGIDAIRCHLYRPMRADQLPDFVLPLSVVEQGFRVVYEPEAIVNEETLSTASAEYRMRVRVTLRALWALWDCRSLLNPFRFPLFSWQLWSHKLLRYGSFAFLAAGCLLDWTVAAQGPVYLLIAVGQVLFVGCVALGAWGPQVVAKLAFVRNCYYFFLLNAACAVAFGKFLAGEVRATWAPRTG